MSTNILPILDFHSSTLPNQAGDINSMNLLVKVNNAIDDVIVNFQIFTTKFHGHTCAVLITNIETAVSAALVLSIYI